MKIPRIWTRLPLALSLLSIVAIPLDAAEAVAPEVGEKSSGGGAPRATVLGDPRDLLTEPGGTPAIGASLRPLAGRLAVDLRDLVRSPIDANGKAWRRFGLSMALVGALHSLDDQVRMELDPSASTSSAAIAIRPLGQEAGIALIAGSWALGHMTGKPTAVRIGRDGMEAVALSAGVLAPLIKKVAGRERPRREMGSGVFGGAGQSFPSGEVAQAFAIASVVSAHSHRKWVKGAAWTLATATAWQRMEMDAHWASDAAAGALLGTAVGRWVVRRNRGTWSVEPQVLDRGAGIRVRKEW